MATICPIATDMISISKPYRGDWLDKLTPILVATLVAITALVLCGLIFIAADSWFVSDRDGTAEVCGRDYTAAWIQTIQHSDGNGGTYPQVIYHPPNWTIKMKMGDEPCGVNVSEHDYNTVRTGETVRVRYRRGRISGGIYITEAFFR